MSIRKSATTSDLLGVGLAAFNTDMPGNGECPVWYTPDAGRFYSTIIDYLLKRDDLDATRLGIIGRSYGGYWGGKMAYVESRRIKAAVQWGGPTHYTFQEAWLQHLKEDKLYLWSLLDSMIYANHVNSFDELLQQAPTMSLKTEGWLDKPAAPDSCDQRRQGWLDQHSGFIHPVGERRSQSGARLSRGRPHGRRSGSGGSGDGVAQRQAGISLAA